MQADHADGIVEGGGLQVELSTGRHLGVGYLQPARQLVGGVGGIEVDVRVARAVVLYLADVALGGYLLVYDAVHLNVQGHVAQLVVARQPADVNAVGADVAGKLLVFTELQFGFGTA